MMDDLRDKEGRLFVDRDPELFAEVLRLLRGCPPRILDNIPWNDIKAEADFYGVPLEAMRPPTEVILPPSVLTVRRLYVEPVTSEILRRDELCMYSMSDLPPDMKSQTRIIAVEVLHGIIRGSKTVFVVSQPVLEEAGFCERPDGTIRAWERTERHSYHAQKAGIELIIPSHPMEVNREIHEHYISVTYAVPPVGHMVTTADGVVGVLHPRNIK